MHASMKLVAKTFNKSCLDVYMLAALIHGRTKFPHGVKHDLLEPPRLMKTKDPHSRPMAKSDPAGWAESTIRTANLSSFAGAGVLDLSLWFRMV